jgi:uncharacterized protein (TIGR03437 family)
VSSVTSAGITNDDAVVAGGQAVLKGTRLAGRDVQVNLGGVASRLVYSGASEIHFEVPSALAGRNTADLVVTVDGSASVPRAVKLKPVMPAIFPGGVVNAGWTENSPSQPATIGTIVKVFFTGIPENQLSTATVRMHDWAGLRPTAAAAMADNPGVSYLDVEVPLGIPAITSDLVVCAQGAEGPVCIAPVKVTLAN